MQHKQLYNNNDTTKRYEFSCPNCLVKLKRETQMLECYKCKSIYPIDEGIAIFLSRQDMDSVNFYEQWHKSPHIAYNLQRLGKPIKSSEFIIKNQAIFQYFLYTQFKRERFFKRVAKMIKNFYEKPLILDLGCGGGNPNIANVGDVCGIDYSITSLKNSFAHKNYTMLANGSVLNLPFESSMFDCVVSSDLIGHIVFENKESFFSEMSRVLKTGGICAHLLETDSDNFVKRFAKRYTNLYQRYFIEGIGGHFGLEMSDVVIDRFKKVGLHPISIRKYSTYIWDIESFIALFDNEYKDKSIVLRSILGFYSLLCKNFKIKVISTMLLGGISFLVDILSPMSKAEGLMVICIKK